MQDGGGYESDPEQDEIEYQRTAREIAEKVRRQHE